MSSPRSVIVPQHRCAWFHRFTSSWPTLTPVARASYTPSETQFTPGRLTTHCAAMLVQVRLLVTIPIDNRRCFSHRFSPTGFILNASDSNLLSPNRSRLAFRLKPIRSVQSQAKNLVFPLDEDLSPSVVNSYLSLLPPA